MARRLSRLQKVKAAKKSQALTAQKSRAVLPTSRSQRVTTVKAKRQAAGRQKEAQLREARAQFRDAPVIGQGKGDIKQAQFRALNPQVQQMRQRQLRAAQATKPAATPLPDELQSKIALQRGGADAIRKFRTQQARQAAGLPPLTTEADVTSAKAEVARLSKPGAAVGPVDQQARRDELRSFLRDGGTVQQFREMKEQERLKALEGAQRRAEQAQRGIQIAATELGRVERAEPTVPTFEAPVVDLDTRPKDVEIGDLSASEELLAFRNQLKERGGRPSTEEQIQLRRLQQAATQEEAAQRFQEVDVIGDRLTGLQAQRQAIVSEQERRAAGIDPEVLALRKEQALERQRLGRQDVARAEAAQTRVQEALSARGVGRSTYAVERAEEIQDQLDQTLERRRELSEIAALRLSAQRTAEGRQQLQQIDNRIQGLFDEQVQAEQRQLENVADYIAEQNLEGEQAIEAFVDALNIADPDTPEVDTQVSKLAGYLADSKGNPIKTDEGGNPIRFDEPKRETQIIKHKGDFVVVDKATGDIIRRASVREQQTGVPSRIGYGGGRTGVGSIGRGLGMGGNTTDNADAIAGAMSSGSTAGLTPQQTQDMITFLANGSKSKRQELERAASLNNGQLPKQLLLDRFNDGQMNAVGFAHRIDDAMAVFDELEGEIGELGAFKHQAQRSMPNMFKSETFQRQDQAERNFINATLRRESGASIADSEFENAAKQYFPQAGDAESVIEQKRKNREEILRGMINSSGGAYEITQALEAGSQPQEAPAAEVPGFDEDDMAFFGEQAAPAAPAVEFDQADEDFFNSL